MRSSYAGTAGLKDDFDYTISSATFSFDSDYMDGKALCMILEGTDENGEEERILLSTGSGWEPKDKGARAVLESTGEPKEGGFNRSCRYHQFLMQAVKSGAEETFDERGEAYDAGIWEGLSFHMARGAIVKGEFVEGALPKNPVSGEEKTAGDLYPTAFLGEGGKGKGKAAKATGTVKKTVGKKVDADEGEGSASDNGDGPISKTLMIKLKKLAKEVGDEDHDTFIERAMDEVDGVADDDAVQEQIVDEEWYAGLFA